MSLLERIEAALKKGETKVITKITTNQLSFLAIEGNDDIPLTPGDEEDFDTYLGKGIICHKKDNAYEYVGE